ncbi:hypothetical protein D3C78_1449240 [compost metagenome]
MRRTEISESLVSKRTEKSFIGAISENEFRVITSEIGIGALCVLSGNVNNQIGQINVELNKAFKVLFSIILCLPIIAVISVLFQDPSDFPFFLIVVVIFQILLIRLMIEVFFRFVSKRSLNRLIDVLDADLVD